MLLFKNKKLCFDRSALAGIPLDAIKCFFVYKAKDIVFVDNDDNCSKLPIKGNYVEDYLYLWHKWSEKLETKENAKIFEYPVPLLFREAREYINLDAFLKIGLLAVLALLAFQAVTLPSRPLFFFILLLSAPLLIDTVLFRRSKKFFEVRITNEAYLKVLFINGDSREFEIKEIRKFSLEPNSNNSFVVLPDGTALQHLERLSHWPILRKHLLSLLT